MKITGSATGAGCVFLYRLMDYFDDMRKFNGEPRSLDERGSLSYVFLPASFKLTLPDFQHVCGLCSTPSLDAVF